MIHGVLVINLDPAYVGFSQYCDYSRGSNPLSYSWQNCSVEDIRCLLLELDMLAPHQSWPPQDCILRLEVSVPRAALARFNLVSAPVLNVVPSDKDFSVAPSFSPVSPHLMSSEVMRLA